MKKIYCLTLIFIILFDSVLIAETQKSLIKFDLTSDDQVEKIFTSTNSDSKSLQLEIKGSNHPYINNSKLLPIKVYPEGWSSPIFKVNVESTVTFFGEVFVNSSTNLKEKNTLFLSSSIDGSPLNYKIYFEYNTSLKNYFPSKAFLASFMTGGDHSLLSVSEIDISAIEDTSINQLEGYDLLKKIKKSSKQKLISQANLDLYKQAKFLYSSSKIMELKKLINSNYIRYDPRTDEPIQPENYIIESLYFEKQPTLSNDLAFFMLTTGHLNESQILLEKIINDHPTRTVAYLNLGDAYWDLDNKNKSKKNYEKYVEQMIKKRKKQLIPRTTLKRLEKQ